MIFQRRVSFSYGVCFHPFICIRKRNLVNVKLKWVKDTVLDSAVSNTVQLKATCTLVSLIGSNPDFSLPIYCLTRYRGHFGLPRDLKVSTFLRRYPNIFEEFYRPDSRGTPVPWYKLTPEALEVYTRELHLVYEDCYVDILNRLQKLLMLTKERLLPLQSIDQLRWDLGLPYDYENKLVAKRKDLFAFVKLPHDRVGLKLLVWDDCLSVSHLMGKTQIEKDEELTFPIGFPRGYGLKRKCMEWLNDWQKLPYTSPYVDASHLDPRTDVSEKRIVGVFHELLNLTILRQIERKNVSNLRGPLAMPQKFTKVFERHPGIFYISKRGGTQTVVLRDGFDRGKLIEKHPLADIWGKYAGMMKEGLLDRSRGLYKKEGSDCDDELVKMSVGGRGLYEYESETEMEYDLLSEYESDDETSKGLFSSNDNYILGRKN